MGMGLAVPEKTRVAVLPALAPRVAYLRGPVIAGAAGS
jgi:hypothetical protein